VLNRSRWAPGKARSRANDLACARMGVVDLTAGMRMDTARGDVVVCVPLYGAHDHFARCLSSLLAHTPADVALLVADDATPDPASRALVEELQAAGALHHTITWLRRDENAGFVGNVNGAFDAAAPADVVIVNSDVVVAAGWLDGLRDATYSDTNIATATALTNHGTIVSVPHRNIPVASLPQAVTLDTAAERIRASSQRLRPRIPVAIGHCLYVRRTAWELVGGFDGAFAPGYGEEVDFSQRCLAMGMQHVVADDVLVAHHGNASFDALEQRSALQLAHEQIINTRYPYYAQVIANAQRDPVSPLARAVGHAARVLRGLRVTIDARILGSMLTGTQVHVLELIAALARTGEVRVRVLLPDVPGDYVDTALAGLTRVERIIEADIPDIELDDLVHRPWQVTDVKDVKLLARLGERIVLTQQDLIAYRNPSYFASAREWLSYRQLAAEAMALSASTLFFSEHARADALREDLVPAERTGVIHLGTDHRVALPSPNPRAPAGVEVSGRPYLLCLGTDFRHKNRLFALRLLDVLRERHGWDGRLVLAGPRVTYGSSSAEEAAFRAARPRLDAAVVDLPAVGEPEKAWLIGNCAAVVYPTTYEGFGLVPFEAAEAGRPCLFAALTSLAEVLDDDAALLVPWDVEASAERAIGVLTDPALAEAQVARVRASAGRFDWDTTGRELVSAYHDALGRPAPLAARVLADGVVADARYWGLRAEIGGAGMSLVEPRRGLLPTDAQRGLAALARRRATRWAIVGPLRFFGRFGQSSRAQRNGSDRDA
jgi:GT2 family glycosyltransferase/glycosyltransferase involved in cell wall biosynthesis